MVVVFLYSKGTSLNKGLQSSPTSGRPLAQCHAKKPGLLVSSASQAPACAYRTLYGLRPQSAFKAVVSLLVERHDGLPNFEVTLYSDVEGKLCLRCLHSESMCK